MGFDQNKVRNILIIKIAAIGDLLLITPAIRAIKKNFPEAKIILLVGKWSRSIIEGNPNIDEIIEVPDEIFFRVRPFSLLSLIFRLRKERFDMVLVWHRSMAFRFFSWLLGIKTRVGFSRNRNARFLTHFVEENPEIHEILEYQETLKSLGIKSSEIDMDLALSETDRQFAEKIWEENGLRPGDKIVGIAPGGGKNPKEIVPLKHWPREYYAELADGLVKEKGAKIIFLGDKDDFPIVRDIESKMRSGAINLSGRSGLKQLAAVIEKCSLFVGNDSAPMHVAAAVRTPVISIFGPTNPKELAPINYRHVYFFAGENCSPCYKNGRFPECYSRECMKKIRPEQVLEAAVRILSF